MKYISPLICLFISTVLTAQKTSFNSKPNIVVILADDLGYGDLSCFNAASKIQTPFSDALAKEGMKFTDAHSSSAVCTPSRYSLLTGRYAWRTRLKKGVLNGYDEPLIDDGRPTVANLLKQQGYNTACIGKWHLGLSWTFKNDTTKTDVDYTKPIKNGPNSLGFDYFFGIAASLDMPPYIYIENDHTIGVAGVTKKWGRSGAAEKDFEAENCVPDFTAKAVGYIKEQSAKKQPFFLYMPLPSPHTPIVVSKQFKDKSGVTEYGDYVLETDWAVGQVMKALEAAGVANNTLVIFTSDNGFAPYVLKTWDVEALGHKPSADFRGYKSDIWEGGHRVPFIARWPATIKAGTTCSATICLSDIMATAAGITHAALPAQSAEDSYNILPYFTGSTTPIREATVHHSINGQFAITKGKWKLELSPGSGGWTAPRNEEAVKQGLPALQLYDLSTDIKEQNNVQAEHPEVVKELTELLERYQKEGRSVLR